MNGTVRQRRVLGAETGRQIQAVGGGGRFLGRSWDLKAYQGFAGEKDQDYRASCSGATASLQRKATAINRGKPLQEEWREERPRGSRAQTAKEGHVPCHGVWLQSHGSEEGLTGAI